MDLNTSVIKREHVKLSVDEIRPVPTAHNSGTKKVLSGEFSHPVMIKQVAVGKLGPGESVELHAHPDMDEHYFILEGNGRIKIDNTVYFIKKGDFMIVTAGSDHELHSNNETLEFFYQSFQILPS